MSRCIDFGLRRRKTQGRVQVILRGTIRLPSTPKEILRRGVCEDCRNFSYHLALAETGLLKCESCSEAAEKV